MFNLLIGNPGLKP